MGNHWRLMAFLLLPCLVVAMVAIGCKPAEGPAGPGNAPEKQPAKEKAGDKAPPEGKAGAEPPAPKDVVDDGLIREGKEEFQSCGTCHCATDPRIEEDDDWVIMNETTSCIAADKPPRVRDAIKAYLRYEETLRPLLVGEDFEPEKDRTCGEITVPATAGSAYLKAERRSIKKGAPPRVRLYWKASSGEKNMTAPLGEYRVINYWLYRQGEDGEQRWMASVTNVDGCATVVVVKDTAGYFFTEPILYGTLTAEKRGNEEGPAQTYALSFALADASANRLSLSMNGNLVIPRYRIVDAAGKEVALGAFEPT